MLIDDLVTLGAPRELVNVWSRHVSDFTDIQDRALRAGALDGQSNLLVMAPTSSGKTLVGEIAATSSAYTRRQHAIFLVPFKALADEHYDLFRQRYGQLLTVVISTADWTEFDADIRAGSFNLAVMTYEKLKIFLAQQPDLLTRCTTLVIDEVQMLSDPHRGASLELLLTQVMLAPDPPQLIALSASVGEVNRLDLWLKAKLVSSADRPIPLTQSVCAPSGSAIALAPNGTTCTAILTNPQSDREGLIVALAEHFLASDKQVMIFRGSVRNVMETARALRSRRRAHGLSQQLDEELNTLEDSDLINDLRLCLASGVGFHDADLTRPERSVVERAFRSGNIRVIVATTTLAMGVNLPADVVIIGDSKRFLPGRPGTWRVRNIPVSEYRNAAGRAGRLGQRTAGFSILVAESPVDQNQLVSGYLLGHVEPVESQIPGRLLADVIFDIVCAQLADSEDHIVEFIAGTFAFLTFYERTGGLSAVRTATTEAVRRCVESGLVAQDGERLYPTQVAQVLGGSGLSLTSAARIAAVLERAVTIEPCRQDLIYEIASCTEVGDRPWLQRRGRTDLDPRPRHAPDGAGCPPESRLARTLGRQYITSDEMGALVRAKCLLEWMSGKSQRSITTEFAGMGAAASRIRDLGKNAAWLLDALTEAARVRSVPPATSKRIHELAIEARYGVPAALAPIARLRVPGISREQMLGLYQNAQGIQLHEPDTIIDAPDDAFRGILSPLHVARLKQAIITDFEESLKRKRAGHRARAEQANLLPALVDALYTATGGALEQAVTDALTHVGLSATRVVRQPNGEEDIRLAHADGTAIISVTASQDDGRPVSWNKAKGILGAGTGLNPINYACLGRPGFHSLAQRNADNIAREAGPRSILLMALPVFAEAIVRIAEGTMSAQQLGNILARGRGYLTSEGLSQAGV